MSELIWIGNTLLPRGVVISVVAVILLIVIGGFTWLTRDVCD